MHWSKGKWKIYEEHEQNQLKLKWWKVLEWKGDNHTRLNNRKKKQINIEIKRKKIKQNLNTEFFLIYYDKLLQSNSYEELK